MQKKVMEALQNLSPHSDPIGEAESENHLCAFLEEKGMDQEQQKVITLPP